MPINHAQFERCLRHLGPQSVVIGGTTYICRARIMNQYQEYLATTPGDYRLFRVDPFAETAEVIPMEQPPAVRPEGIECLSLREIIQAMARYKLNGEEDDFAEMAEYILTVYPPKLVQQEALRQALIGELHKEGLTNQALKLLTPEQPESSQMTYALMAIAEYRFQQIRPTA